MKSTENLKGYSYGFFISGTLTGITDAFVGAADMLVKVMFLFGCFIAVEIARSICKSIESLKEPK